MTEQSKNYDVVIVGAGFAGTAAAHRLGKHGVSTLLIDRNNYQQFQPLLYQVATAQLPPNVVAEPLRDTFRETPSVRVLTAEVTAIDAATRQVTLADGSVFSGQKLVIAVGAEVNFFGTQGAAEYAYPLYSVADAARLAAALLAELDAADAAAVHGAAQPTNIIVVGAGPTGVELAGALAESVRSVVPKYFAEGVDEHIAIHLVDLGSAVLGPFAAPLQGYASERLEHLGVKLHLGTGVQEIREAQVTLSDDSVMPAHIVIWAGGMHAPAVVADSGAPTGHGGRINVQRDLSVPGFPGVYALGDAANIPAAGGGSLPQLGAVALQAGEWAGNNLLAELAGKSPTAFIYHDRGFMAMVGKMAAVAEVGAGHKQLHGPLAFGAWLAVHDTLLPTFRSRRSAVSHWFQDYLTNHREEFVVGFPSPTRRQ